MAALNIGPAVAAEQRVHEFFVWVAVHDNGGEGVVGVQVPGLGITNATAASERAALLFEPFVRDALGAPRILGSSHPVRLELRRFGLLSKLNDRYQLVKVIP